FNDLREFIAEIEAEGELRRLEGVSADLEMGAITEIYAAEAGPAVLFDRIPGHAAGYRLVSNLFATLTRTAKVLRLDPSLDGVAMLGAWREKLRSYQGIAPIEVPDGPVLTNRLTGDAPDRGLPRRRSDGLRLRRDAAAAGSERAGLRRLAARPAGRGDSRAADRTADSGAVGDRPRGRDPAARPVADAGRRPVRGVAGLL